MGLYARPVSLDEALRLRSAGARIIAGGTDLYPAAVTDPARLGQGDIIDLTGCPALTGISQTSDGWRIGAATSWAAIRDAELPVELAALQRAAAEVGGRQVQSRGTIGGNIVNASPAADGIPALMALDAQVELRCAGVRRILSLDEFVLGPRHTALAADEILTAVLLPHAPEGGARRSHFLKLGARRYLVISIVMAAGSLDVASGRVVRSRIAVGSASAVAMRLAALERDLEGVPIARIGDVVRDDHVACLTPIEDVRADAHYRREAALVLTRRLLQDLSEAA